MGVRRDDLIEVALEDGDGPDDASPGDDGGSGSRRRRRRPWSPRRRRAVAAAALALVLGTVAVRGDAAAMREARLAGVPGLSVSLAAPLRALWQVDGRILGWSRDGGTVLVSTDEALEALDAASGAPRWRRDGAASWCDLSSPGPAAADTQDQAGGASETALCTLVDGTALEALDVATGELLLTIRPEWPEWSSVMVDGDAVLAGVDDAGRVEVVRWRTVTGERAWTAVGPQIGGEYQGVWVSAGGPDLTVEWATGSMLLDAATGTELPGPSDAVGGSDPGVESSVLPDGSVATQEWDRAGLDLSAARVSVVSADGTDLLTVPGVLVTPVVDDGSASGLVLVQDLPSSTTRAYDLGTSAEVWSRGFSPALLVDGRVVGWDSAGSLVAVDARTGDLLWTQAVQWSTDWWSVVSDGQRVLSLEGPGQRLVARSLATGRTTWSLDQPWVTAGRLDSFGTYGYGSVTLSVMPSGRVVLSGASGAAVLVP